MPVNLAVILADFSQNILEGRMRVHTIRTQISFMNQKLAIERTNEYFDAPDVRVVCSFLSKKLFIDYSSHIFILLNKIFHNIGPIS